MPRITVERARTDEDLECALKIWEAANHSRRRPAGPVRAARVRAKVYASDLVLLAWYGERPAGMLVAEAFVDTTPHPDRGHIAMVFVDPAVWGSGVGTRLLRSVQDLDWSSLSVWTRTDNVRAQRLYAAAGFDDSGNRAHLQDGDVIMQLLWQRAVHDVAR